MSLTFNQKKKLLNNMNSAAQKAGLGDLIAQRPITVSKTLAADDISSSKAEIDTGIDVTAIASVTCISSGGALRAVTKAELKSGSDTVLEVTATSMAATDVLTVTVI